MTVTAILPTAGNRFKIYLNDAFAFVLYKGDLRHYGVEEGVELTEETLRLIYSEALCKRAKLRAMHLLEARDYTEEAMRRKLRAGLYPEDVVEAAVAYVVNCRYIDDARYADSYVRMHCASESARRMIEKLAQKGISSDLTRARIAAYEEENGNPEEETLQKQLSKELLRLGRCPAALSYEERQKLFAKFYRKGFRLDLLERVFAKLLESEREGTE